MKEIYPVLYKNVEGGRLCTSEEFGLKDFLIENKDGEDTYNKLVDLFAGQLVVDVRETWILRAPYEEKMTPFETADTEGLFIIHSEDLRNGYVKKIRKENNRT